MKGSLVTCLVLVWLAAAQAGETKPIAVTAGKEFKITLPSNATSGYQWVLAKAPDEKLVKLLHSDYKRPDSKLAGAGGQMVWTFRALAAGKTELGLDYVRSWEKGQKPAQTTNFMVLIKAAKDSGKTPAPAPGT
jgi:inhibitor of cysteine peptidase